MSELKSLDDFGDLRVRSHTSSWYSNVLLADGDLLGCERAILKFESNSACELLAYQLAAALGVPVPRVQGVWTPSAGNLATGNKYNACRIGILVEEIPNLKWKTCLADIGKEELDRIGSDAIARAFALCTFDGNEWGEFVSTSNGAIYFIDLENVLGPLEPESLFALGSRARKSTIRSWKKTCAGWARPSVDAVFCEAQRLGIVELVRSELRRLCNLPKSERARIVSITGHPLDQEISEFSADMLEDRISVIMPVFGIPHTQRG